MSLPPDPNSDPGADVIAVDTRVWLDGLVRGSAAEELVRLGMTGHVRLVTSEAMVVELERILTGSLEFSPRALAEVRQTVQDAAIIVPDDGSDLAAPAPILAVASRLGANAVATTDGSPWLEMGEYGGVPIVAIG